MKYAIVISLTLPVFILFTSTVPDNQGLADLPKGTKPFSTAEQVYQAVWKTDDTVDHVLLTLRSLPVDRHSDSVYAACLGALGNLRTHKKEAIALLVRQIDYKLVDMPDWPNRPSYWVYHAAQSLAEIGPIVYPDMLQVIMDSKATPEQRQVAAWVLIETQYVMTRYSSYEDSVEIARKYLEEVRRNVQPGENPHFAPLLDEAIEFVANFTESTPLPGESPAPAEVPK